MDVTPSEAEENGAFTISYALLLKHMKLIETAFRITTRKCHVVCTCGPYKLTLTGKEKKNTLFFRPSQNEAKKLCHPSLGS